MYFKIVRLKVLSFASMATEHYLDQQGRPAYLCMGRMFFYQSSAESERPVLSSGPECWSSDRWSCG